MRWISCAEVKFFLLYKTQCNCCDEGSFWCQKSNLVLFSFLASGASESRGGASGAGANNAVNKYDKLVAAPDESAEHETSPNLSKHRTQGKEKRIPTKMHHANRGKQQKDRRKLREKRRSTGKKKWFYFYSFLPKGIQ